MVRVYDKFGVEQTLDWLHQEFGNVEIEAPPSPAASAGGLATRGAAAASYFEVAELREIGDLGPAQGSGHVSAYAAIVVRVVDEHGSPLPGTPCVFWWPDAPALPGSGWHEHGIGGATGPAGTVDFPMGPGAFYDPAHAQGPHHLWIYGEGRSEIIRGLGMVAGTNHRHLDVTFQRAGSQPPADPPPPGPGDVVLKICAAKAAIDAAEVCLAEALQALGGRCPE